MRRVLIVAVVLFLLDADKRIVYKLSGSAGEGVLEKTIRKNLEK